MTLRDKIEKLIIELGLTSTRFADYIGINRPIISHILSGRNKPSLEIVQKIVSKFPELGFNWISDDEDLDLNIVHQIANSQDFNELFNFNSTSRGFNDLNIAEGTLDLFNSQGLGKPKISKKVERVLVFYNDNTFEQFNLASE